MTSKNNSLPLKDKRDIGADNSTTDQYRNLSLNQTHQKFSVAFSEIPKSVSIEKRKGFNPVRIFVKQVKRTAAPTKMSDFANNDFSQARKDSHSWNKSKKDFPSDFGSDSYGKENGLKKRKNSVTNDSHLSLYIAAYENSNVTLVDLKQNDLNKKWETAKQIAFDPISVVQNPFEFPRQENDKVSEPDVSQFKASQRLLNPNKASKNGQQNVSKMIRFNTDNMAYQKFDAFPKPIMDYILEHLEPQHLVKLYNTSKYFYCNFPRMIIQNLEIVCGRPEKFDLMKTVVDYRNPLLSKLKDFLFFDSFICHGFLPNVLYSFTNFNIKKLELCEEMYWSEFTILTKIGTIEELKTEGLYYYQYDYVCVEKIIAEVPNATSIEIRFCRFNEKTLDTMIASDHKGKISNFVLKNIWGTAYVKGDLFVDFFFKHGAENCNIDIGCTLWSDQYRANESNETRMINYTKRIAEAIEKKKKIAL